MASASAGDTFTAIALSAYLYSATVSKEPTADSALVIISACFFSR